MDLMAKVRQEYAGERLTVSITIEDLTELINRKQGLAILAANDAEDLYTQIQEELAKLAKLRHEYLASNPRVEVMKVPEEPKKDADDDNVGFQ